MSYLKDEMVYWNWCPLTSIELCKGATFNAPQFSDNQHVRYPDEGYKVALSCFGIKHFSYDEITTPNDMAKARSAGFNALVPPMHCWALSLAVVGFAEVIRSTVGDPISMRNHWRPQSYNKLVSTSGIDSDHPNACAVDLDFRNKLDHREALDLLSNMLGEQDFVRLRPSIGIGERSLHLGIMSPRGARHWVYDSFKGEVPAAIRQLGR